MVLICHNETDHERICHDAINWLLSPTVHPVTRLLCVQRDTSHPFDAHITNQQLQGGQSHVSQWTIISSIFLFPLSWFKKTPLSFTQPDSFPAGVSSENDDFFCRSVWTGHQCQMRFQPDETDSQTWISDENFSHLQIDTFASCRSLTVTFPKGIPDSKHITSGIWGFHHKQGCKNQQKQTQHWIWQIFTKKNSTQPLWQPSHRNYTPCMPVQFRKPEWKEIISILWGKLKLPWVKSSLCNQPPKALPNSQAGLEDDFRQLKATEVCV